MFVVAQKQERVLETSRLGTFTSQVECALATNVVLLLSTGGSRGGVSSLKLLESYSATRYYTFLLHFLFYY